MKKFKYILNEIIYKIDLEQKIVLNNDLELIVKSKPYLKDEKYYVKCLKDEKISIFCVNYWFEKELVKYDSKDLFAERYINKCWKCKSTIDNIYCERCDICGWYICNKCHSCRSEYTQRIKRLCNRLSIV